MAAIRQYVLIFCHIFMCVFTLFGSKKLTENYINKFKNLAVTEMYRTGIPASIKLAQGILESDLGRSPLASHANNHFGIKCGKDWIGTIYYKHDDDMDSTGTIIESCFRSYHNADQSYIDHSEFLIHPAKKSRYGFLFELSTTDYVGWANGLKFAGYASDPSYPSKLIKIIENYRLYEYDIQVNPIKQEYTAVTKTEKSRASVKSEKDPENFKKQDKTIASALSKEVPIQKNHIGKYQVKKVNDIKMVHAFGGESIKELALRNKKNVHDLLEFNEKIESPDHILEAGEIVFFDKKKRSVEDEALAFHTVTKGETLYTISQKYGVRMESIALKNNLPENGEPLQGELVSLSRNLSKKESPKYKIIEKIDSFIDFGGLQ